MLIDTSNLMEKLQVSEKTYKLTLTDSNKSESIKCHPSDLNYRIERFLRRYRDSMWSTENDDIEVLVEDLSENPEPKYYSHFSPIMDVVGYAHEYDEEFEEDKK